MESVELDRLACEEDRTLRAVLVGMLREGDAGIRDLNG